MRSFPHRQQSWALQPLVDAGLDAEQIRDLLVRLSFDAMVCADQSAPPDAMTPVADRPAQVRAAWAETVDRMVRLGPGKDVAAVTGSATPRSPGTRRPRSGRRGPTG